MENKKIICDTDVIIDYFDQSNSRYKQTRSILDEKIGLRNIVISAITKMELLAGAISKPNLNLIKANIGGIELLFVNHEITLTALSLIETYKLSHNLAMADSFIAATSLFTGYPLFTYNLKDYKFIANINIYHPETA